MTEKLGDQPAFPQTIDDMGTMRSVTEGLTKRELCAFMVLQGTMANPEELEQWAHSNVKPSLVRETIAHTCVLMTDSLLAELEKEKA